jgi:hypothetical protein
MNTPATTTKSPTVPEFSRETGLPAGVLRRLIVEGRVPGFYSGTKEKRGRFYINAGAARAVLAPMASANQP